MAISPQNNLIHAENTPPIGLDGRGLPGFEYPEIRLWCLFWQSVKWGGPSMGVMSENDIQRTRTTTLTSPKRPSEGRAWQGRQIPMCARGWCNFYLGLIGVGSSTEPCRNAWSLHPPHHQKAPNVCAFVYKRRIHLLYTNASSFLMSCIFLVVCPTRMRGLYASQACEKASRVPLEKMVRLHAHWAYHGVCKICGASSGASATNWL